ncbi:MAG: double zinc ribbon domain-containing protein [Pseudomonas sp.]|nr:double zinc ribbon domain-containing protein [Pseudomonas sp.]
MSCQPDIFTKVYHWLKSKQSCLLCDAPSQRLLALCEDCETELPWLKSHCIQCALPIPDPHALCADCTHNPPLFSKVISPFEFTFPLDTLISRFKYQQNWPYGQLLSNLLAQYLNHYFDQGGQRPDLILAVPLAKRRQRQRGYNQAQMVCDWLSKALALDNPKHLLLRTRETISQQGLNAKARRDNLHNAFALSEPAQIKNKHIALVDDVLTTGSTCSTISGLLLEQGAARVEVYCLARTAKPLTISL